MATKSAVPARCWRPAGRVFQQPDRSHPTFWEALLRGDLDQGATDRKPDEMRVSVPSQAMENKSSPGTAVRAQREAP